MQIERLDIDAWGSALPDSGIELFHQPEPLRVLDEHVEGELELYGGFKGQQPIGLLPVITDSKFVGTTITSPPPSMNVPRLGPVVMPTSPKQRKRESVNQQFTGAVLDEIDTGGSLSLFRMICNSQYLDPRPYVWAEYDLTTQFTYLLDLADTTTDETMAAFSSSLRREIRSAQDLDVTVAVEGLDGARTIYDATRQRYAQQGRSFPIEWDYVRDLVTALDDRARPYVARGPDGEFLGGITALYSPDAAYFWQGGAKSTYEGLSVNSLVHWQIIADIVEDDALDSVTGYDLMGANTERLCRYKSKFGAELVPYYVVESEGIGMDVAKATYTTLKR